MAEWLYIGQAQLSRVERGRAITDLSRLILWSDILGLPWELRWFSSSPGHVGVDTVTVTSLDEAPDKVALVHDEQRLLLHLGNFRLMIPVSLESLLDRQSLREIARHGADLFTLSGVNLTNSSEGRDRSHQLNRRTFLAGVGAAVAVPTLGMPEIARIAATFSETRRFSSGELLHEFRKLLTGYAVNDGAGGARTALPPVLGLMAAIQRSLREANSSVRERLVILGAECSEFVAWLYRDLSAPVEAEFWRDRAMEWAQEANDLPAQAYILLKKSQAAWDTRDAPRMLSLARAVRQGPWNAPKRVLAEAAQQEARSLAMLGYDFDVIRGRLAEAEDLLAQDDLHEIEDRDWQLSGHYSHSLLGVQKAICLSEAGKVDAAADLYSTWLAKGRHSYRDFGYLTSIMARAYAIAGLPDESCDAGMQAYSIALQTNSRRTIQELSGVLRVLRDSANRPAVREFRHTLLTAQRA